MLIEVLMPKHGLNMSEGLITIWHKKEGDTVKSGDILFEFETEKATVEFESQTAGVITQVLFPEGESAPVNDAVCLIETDMEAVQQKAQPTSAAKPAAAPVAQPASAPVAQPASAPLAQPASAPVAQPALAPANVSHPEVINSAIPSQLPSSQELDYVPATPFVKKTASQAGVDLHNVTGTGNAGRITAQDVLASLSVPEVSAGRIESAIIEPVPADNREKLAMSRIKKLTGERLAKSFSTVPHIYFSAQVNLEKLSKHRAAILQDLGQNFSYSDFILLACARALEKYPIANAAYEQGELIKQSSINIGFATATDKGLLVPVVHDAQMYTLAELARRRKALVDKALAGKLDISEMEGGTFTITNLGSFGIDTFDPIINPPQAAILAMGAINDQVVVVDKSIRICPIMNLRLAADHRVLDGVECARFLGHIKKLLQLEETLG